MKVLIAGATGAIGHPLVHHMKIARHTVYGITQSEDHAKELASNHIFPIVLNVLDRDAVFAAVKEVQPDVIVDMLTSLPKEYTPEAMQNAAEKDAKIRLEGGANLQKAAEQFGVKRYIAQSSGFFYAPGDGLADENTPFAFDATPGIAAGAKIYAEIEKRVLNAKFDGVALRFGFFYGPGTWFYPNGNVADQVRKQQFPIIGQGQGVWSFIHIDDAAKAVVAALDCPPGAYNIINDSPSKMTEWLPAFARYVGATPPLRLSEKDGQEQRGPDATYYATKLRGASNAKAKCAFQLQTRPFEWLK